MSLTPDQQWLRNGLRHQVSHHRQEARRARVRGTRHQPPYAAHSRALAALHDQCAALWQAAIDRLEKEGTP